MIKIEKSIIKLHTKHCVHYTIHLLCITYQTSYLAILSCLISLTKIHQFSIQFTTETRVNESRKFSTALSSHRNNLFKYWYTCMLNLWTFVSFILDNALLRVKFTFIGFSLYFLIIIKAKSILNKLVKIKKHKWKRNLKNFKD